MQGVLQKKYKAKGESSAFSPLAPLSNLDLAVLSFKGFNAITN